jgi:thiol-disulfide isomerase/thioredoxin
VNASRRFLFYLDNGVMRIIKATLFYGLLTCLLLSVGCLESDPGSNNTSAPGGATAEESSAAYTLTVGDAAHLKELIAKEKGKIVLVDMWATWCGPCVDQFPHTVDLHNKHKDNGLAVIAVSFDDLADPTAESRVRKFLDEVHADFPVMISEYDISESIDDFEMRGSIPEYRLYDREGNLLKLFEEGVSAQAIDVAVKEALRKE